jgi:hypothetical protein
MARSSRRRGRLLLLGAAVVAAGVFLKRDKVAGLLPSRAETYSPPAAGPSNYDAPGPVANTATAVPVPEPYEPDPVDEAAEEAAAAAEAANIGGTVSDYAGPTGLPATEAERPLAEAGEGEAEGQEQAELDLERAAEPTAPGMSGAEHQIEDTIEQAANPLAGETLDPVAPPDEDEPSADAPTEPLTRGDEPLPEDAPAGNEPDEAPVGEGGPVPRPDDPAPFEPPKTDEPKTDEPKTDEPKTDEPKADEPGSDDDKDDGGSDWRTWSGRSINP